MSDSEDENNKSSPENLPNNEANGEIYEDIPTYSTYIPTQKLNFPTKHGLIGRAHPSKLVENSTLGLIPLPELDYNLLLPTTVIKERGLSDAQVEVVRSCFHCWEGFLGDVVDGDEIAGVGNVFGVNNYVNDNGEGFFITIGRGLLGILIRILLMTMTINPFEITRCLVIINRVI